MKPTKKDYEHYAKCQLPIKECHWCCRILGNEVEE